METDLFNYTNSQVFSQLNDNKLLYPIGFCSKNLNYIECNYKIYSNKLLAIIRYFK